MKRIVLALACLSASILPARAACTATVGTTVPAREDASSEIGPGDDFGTPTQLQVFPDEQTSFICAHGGYCYPSAAITLNGCAIVPDPDPSASGEPDEPILFLLKSE